VSRYDDLESCSDLIDADAERAVASAADLQELLARCAEIAKSGEGAARVLMVVARLARGDVPWIEGEPRAELIPLGDEKTTLTLYSDLGFGLRERLVPDTTLPVPFAELARAVELAPGLVTPLEYRRERGRLVLARNARDVSAIPPPGKLADMTMPPHDDADRASAAPTRPPAAPLEAAAISSIPGSSASLNTRPTRPVSLADIEELLAREAKSRS
jgi:hypothetical protein